jgi:hypothetical protein
MSGDLPVNRFERPDQPPVLKSAEPATDTQFSVLNELKTASGTTVEYRDAGTCSLTDMHGVTVEGRWTTDNDGNRNFYFDGGQKVCLTRLGTIIEVTPEGAVENSTLLTKEGVLVKTHGKQVSTKFPNGVFIDAHRQITDRSGTHAPDRVTVDPDGTRNYNLKRGDNAETVYSIAKDGTATVAERMFAKNVLLSEKKTQWRPNSEVQIKTRQQDVELKVRGVFVQLEGREVFRAPTGFYAERTPGGTTIMKAGGKTRTFKQGVLKIKNDRSGEEIEYQVDHPKKDPCVGAHSRVKEPPTFTFSDGTTLSYTTVSGDHDKKENSNCIYISMPNHEHGRDHFFIRPHSSCFAFVSTTIDVVLGADYDFQFTHKIFDV